MKIAVRTDASAEIGTGHLMRCLTLSDALKGAGAATTILAAPSVEPWRRLIEGRGHGLVTLPVASERSPRESDGLAHAGWLPWGQAADAAATLRSLPEPVDWLVVDHYALDHRWERAVRPRAKRILAIDDIADRAHEVDMLLDHNPQEETGRRYDGLLPAGARRLIGPRYALLRPAFAAARAGRTERDGVRRVNIMMGGADAAGATLVALEAMAEKDLLGIAVDVVIGGASPHLAAIRAAADARGNAMVHVDVADITALFAAADLAIGAGGVAALERCCVGLPTVAVTVAANQEPGLAALAAAGAVHHLGRLEAVAAGDLADAVRRLVTETELLYKIGESARGIADGRGVERVMASLQIGSPA